ncbi:hypothetical protein Hanom_Chr02g00127461 [Helianthus anomalus]
MENHKKQSSMSFKNSLKLILPSLSTSYRSIIRLQSLPDIRRHAISESAYCNSFSSI